MDDKINEKELRVFWLVGNGFNLQLAKSLDFPELKFNFKEFKLNLEDDNYINELPIYVDPVQISRDYPKPEMQGYLNYFTQASWFLKYFAEKFCLFKVFEDGEKNYNFSLLENKMKEFEKSLRCWFNKEHCAFQKINSNVNLKTKESKPKLLTLRMKLKNKILKLEYQYVRSSNYFTKIYDLKIEEIVRCLWEIFCFLIKQWCEKIREKLNEFVKNNSAKQNFEMNFIDVFFKKSNIQKGYLLTTNYDRILINEFDRYSNSNISDKNVTGIHGTFETNDSLLVHPVGKEIVDNRLRDFFIKNYLEQYLNDENNFEGILCIYGFNFRNDEHLVKLLIQQIKTLRKIVFYSHHVPVDDEDKSDKTKIKKKKSWEIALEIIINLLIERKILFVVKDSRDLGIDSSKDDYIEENEFSLRDLINYKKDHDL